MSWTIERRGRIAVVTMNTNPVNAQNRAFFADLHDAFDRLERDHAECPVVLTGVGARFSAGLDLGEHFRLFAGDTDKVAEWFLDYRATNMRLFTYPRPTVAAVNGHAFAGGLITAAVCDRTVGAAGDARFGINEVNIGIPMPAVYLRMLTYAWGQPVASRTCLQGEIFSVDEATRWEFCTRSCRRKKCSTGPWRSPTSPPKIASTTTPTPRRRCRPPPCATSRSCPTRSTAANSRPG